MALATEPQAPTLTALLADVAPLRRRLERHPLYAALRSPADLRVFMEHHVFAVWDFMSLLKALQVRLTCPAVPWVPPPNPRACRLVNEIVLGEESDEDGRGGHRSHFELYRDAMLGLGASTAAIDRTIDRVSDGADPLAAMAEAGAPAAARRFVARTWAVIATGEVHRIAAAFTLGREDIIPTMFRAVLDQSCSQAEGPAAAFCYYLDRHVSLDGDEHGPAALRLLADVCGDDPSRWAAARETIVASLEARAALWDDVLAALGR